MRRPLIVALLCTLAGEAAGQNPQRWTLSGQVRDAETGEPLPAGIIRVLGTSLGTVVREGGAYRLSLQQGIHRLLFSSIGYRPDTIRITLDSAATLDVNLQPAEIVLPEVLVSSEDPAVEIMRRAIAAKKQWTRTLVSYSMEAFTRQVLSRDTSIAGISESYSRGFWQKGDTLREVILQRRQTANIKAEANVASVGRILNFNEDRIRFLGYTFVGPTADDALDHYEYTLLRTRTTGTAGYHEIRMTPRTRTAPLFSGTVTIAESSYALIGVDVQPNEAFLIPFVRERTVRYRQEFSRYGDGFWMPVDIRIDGRFTVSVPLLSLPTIGFEQTSVIYDYDVNAPVPDSIAVKPRLTVDSAASVLDSTLWTGVQVLPLTPREREAYTTIDSTRTLEVQFRPGGIGARLGGTGDAFPFLDFVDVAFNRVEGVHAGVRYAGGEQVQFVAGAAYGFSNKVVTYIAGATVYTDREALFGVGAEVSRRMDHRPDQGYYGPLFNSFTCLLGKNDYRDYLLAEGWRASLVAAPESWFHSELSYLAEQHRSVENNTDFSILFGSRSYRPNPPGTEGRYRAVRLEVRLGPEPVPLDLILHDGLTLTAEAGRFPDGDAGTFTRLCIAGSIAVPTFGESHLLAPQLRAGIAAGITGGSVPRQRTFDLESASSGVAPFGVLRGARVKEYSGTAFMALHLEHNFRSLPFLALGIPFLYERGIEVLLTGAAAASWNRGQLPLTTTDGWYYEAGVGIGRLFELLRIDCTWRLSAPRRVVLTVGVSSVF